MRLVNELDIMLSKDLLKRCYGITNNMVGNGFNKCVRC